jgi:hypothetical protein
MRLIASSTFTAWLFFASATFAQPEPEPEPEPAPQPAPQPAPEAEPARTPAPAPPPTPVQPVAPVPQAPPIEERVEAYEGRAAPPTSAGTTEFAAKLRPGMEVFAEYAYRRTEYPDGASTWYHELDVPRVHLSLDGEAGDARGRILIEGVHSAGEGALVGVAGDSLVLRAREAYAAYRVWWLEGMAGIVPKLTLPELDGTWMLRAVAAAPQETSGILFPADVGARVRMELPEQHGWAAVAIYNGEGYTNRELNRGKNFEVAASIHPLGEGPLLPLAIFASYELGSSGTGLARADRATGALLWQGELVRAGVGGTYAWGVEDDGARRSIVASVFLRAEPVERVLLGARADRFWLDTNTDSDATVTAVTLTAGYRLADPLEAFVVGTRSLASDSAQAALPGTDYWEARAVTRIVF